MKKILLLSCLLASIFVFVGCGSTPDNTGTANANYEQINLGHDGWATVPQNTTLPAGKDYKIVITPEKNGTGCMSTIKREGSTVADAKVVKAGTPIEFVMNDPTPGTYNFVCNGMSMKQGSITIQG